jgi:hypothetical protein
MMHYQQNIVSTPDCHKRLARRPAAKIPLGDSNFQFWTTIATTDDDELLTPMSH